MTALNASDPSNVQFSNQAADGAAPAADDSDSDDDDDGEKQKQKQNTAKPTPTPTPGAPVAGAGATTAGGGQKVAVAPEGCVAASAAGDAGANAAKPADAVEAFYGDESSVRTGESKTDGTTAV
jgi:hypothetical protein